MPEYDSEVDTTEAQDGTTNNERDKNVWRKLRDNISERVRRLGIKEGSLGHNDER